MNAISDYSNGIHGEVRVPGDKSISHRAAMLLSLCKGTYKVDNYLLSYDCLYTIKALRMLGVKIYYKDGILNIKGNGLDGLKIPPAPIYLGNSGTSMRLLSGIFSSINGTCVLYGDYSLNKRPMKRIIEPIKLMGGEIDSFNRENPPLIIRGKELSGIEYYMNVSSAQVKSCILIASLFSKGETTIIEPVITRDHTERMLKFLGCKIDCVKSSIKMKCGQSLKGCNITIPGDISSAAYLIAAALLVPGSDLIIKGIGFNPTRTGFIDAVRKMGGNIEVLNYFELNNEPMADIRVKSSELNSIDIYGDMIPRLIDEIPIIAVLASFAEGETHIFNAGELKLKESNRIKTICYNLEVLGVDFEELDDGIKIIGGVKNSFKERVFNSFNDHRIAMAFSIAGFVLGKSLILNCDSIKTSFPGFFDTMNLIGANIRAY